MMLTKETVYTQDLDNKQMKVTRGFDAPVEKVWRAWTESELLDQWWAPKPWKANTVSMDFKPGGRWFYFMEGPDASRHYCVLDYGAIEPQKWYEGSDAFADEKGTINTEFPRMHWHIDFTANGDTTEVQVQITFDKVEDLQKIVEMGFKEGFAMGHQNLDELLATM